MQCGRGAQLKFVVEAAEGSSALSLIISVIQQVYTKPSTEVQVGLLWSQPHRSPSFPDCGPTAGTLQASAVTPL